MQTYLVLLHFLFVMISNFVIPIPCWWISVLSEPENLWRSPGPSRDIILNICKSPQQHHYFHRFIQNTHIQAQRKGKRGLIFVAQHSSLENLTCCLSTHWFKPTKNHSMCFLFFVSKQKTQFVHRFGERCRRIIPTSSVRYVVGSWEVSACFHNLVKRMFPVILTTNQKKKTQKKTPKKIINQSHIWKKEKKRKRFKMTTVSNTRNKTS